MDLSLLGLLTDNTTAIVCLKDIEGRYLFVNKRFHDLFSAGHESMIGLSPYDVLPEDLATEYVTTDRAILESRQTVTAETVIPTPGGDRTFMLTKFPVDTEDGTSALGLIGTDITAERAAEKRQEEAERQAEESRKWLESALDNMSEAIIIYDADDKLVRCNKRFLEFFDYKADEMTPGTPAEVLIKLGLQRNMFSEEDQNAFLKSREQQLATGKGSFEFQTKDGRWVLVRDRNIPTGGLISVQTDITSRKKLEMELLEAKAATEQEIVRQRDELLLSEKRMRAVVEDQTEMISRLDTDLNITFANMAYRRTFLDDPDNDDAVGRNILDGFADEEMRETFKRNMQSLTPESPVLYNELLEHVADGTAQWQAWRERALFDDDGKLIGYQSVGRDITGKKVAEEALEANLRERQAIVDGALDAIVSVDLDGVIREANLAAGTMYGCARDELIGQSVLDFLGPESRKIYVEGFERLRAGEIEIDTQQMRAEIQGKKKDGTIFPVERAVAHIDNDGDQRLVGFMRDLTEAKQVEIELEKQRQAIAQNEKMSAMGSLLANVAHELNNPLAVVIGQSDLLYELAQDDKLRARAERIKGAAKRCAAIVKTFLTAVRQREPERIYFDPSRPLRESIDLLEYSLSTSGVVLETRIATNLPALHGDPDQIGQVITNLIVNAQQALLDHEDDRRILVELDIADDGDQVVFSLSDNGPGIAVEKRDRIFEPFFTTKEEGAGTGIGLAIVHNIVEAHDGSIATDQAPELGGARFLLTLPAVAGAIESQPNSTASASERRRLSVLVVDDEKEVADTAADHLILAGHSCETARNGEEGLALMANTEFDVIISDLRMPVLDGPGLFRQAIERWPVIKERFGFFTGDSLSAGARKFLTSGDILAIDKPFTSDALLDLVNRVSERDRDSQ